MDENKDKIKAVLVRFINGLDGAIKDASNALAELADDTPPAPTDDTPPAPTETPAESDVVQSIDDTGSDFNERLNRALEILNERGDK